MLEVDAGDNEVVTYTNLAAVWQNGIWHEIKEMCYEFLNTEKTVPINLDQHLPNVYRDQTIDMSTVWQWVMHFSNVCKSGSPLLVQTFMHVASCSSPVNV